MQEKTVEFREDESGFGVLALRPLRLHHSHVQMGKRHLVGCSFCEGSPPRYLPLLFPLTPRVTLLGERR